MSVTIQFIFTKYSTNTFKEKNIINTLENLKSEYQYDIVNHDNKKITLCFYPFNYVTLVFNRQYINGEIDTSYLGPGFHHHMINFLDTFLKQFNCTSKIHDKTNYYEDRDFNKLQEFFINNLKNHMMFMVDNNLNDYYEWPFNSWYPMKKEGIITHMGCYTHDQIKKFYSEDKFVELAQEYYIWFNKEKDGYFYRNFIIFLMQCYITWTPKDETNSFLKNEFNEAYKKMLTLDININYPKQIDEIKYLYEKGELPPLEERSNIGYLRDDIYINLDDNFSTIIPGNMLKVINENNITYINDDFQLSFSTSTFSQNTKISSQFPKNDYTVDLEKDNHTYHAKYFLDESENNIWIFVGEVLTEKGKCNVLFAYKHYYDYDRIYNIFINIKRYNYLLTNCFEYIISSSNITIRFFKQGIYVVDHNTVISYEDIEFYYYEEYQNKYLRTNFKNNLSLHYVTFVLDENIDYIIKEFHLHVKNIDKQGQFLKKEKKHFYTLSISTIPKKEKNNFILFYIMISAFSLLIFTVFLSEKEPIINLFYTLIPLIYVNLMYCIYILAILRVSNKGFKLISSYCRIFISFADFEKVVIKIDKIMIIGKNTSFEFKKNDKIVHEIEKYVSSEMIEKEY